MKYALALFLCVAGCVRKILGIGPGLSSISPHCNKVNLLMKKYPWSWSVFGIFLFRLLIYCKYEFSCSKEVG